MPVPPPTPEEKIAHLQMIQAVITRMGSNSFFLKGWSVTLVAAIFALIEKNAGSALLPLAALPVLMFWGLDTFFLQQERFFRALYDAARKDEEHTRQFSMNWTACIPQPNTINRNKWWRVFFSGTLSYFHGSLLALVILGLVILHWTNISG